MTETSEGGVRVVWLDRAGRDRGVLVHLHGGAYVMGPGVEHWAALAELRSRTGLSGAMVMFRTPPEDPHPAALDDVLAALPGIVGDRPWVLSGDSAGAGLAVAVAQRLVRDPGVPAPAGLLLNAPWVDLSLAHPETRAHGPADRLLHRRWLSGAAREYAAGTPLTDPALSPLHGPLAGLPPIHLHVGTRDLFLPESRRLRDAVRAAGGVVDHLEQEGGVHGYVMAGLPESEGTYAAQAAWARAVLGLST